MDVHRLDLDLKLCVCRGCGASWIRDTNAFDRLEESLARMALATTAMVASVDALKISCQKLTNVRQIRLERREHHSLDSE